MELSVIIPVYNISSYIEKCVESILTQEIEGIEVILVDDGSTDGSADICDSLAEKDCRVKVIHKPNGGVNTARNRGLGEAKGEWIAFVDGDDFVEDNTFKKNFEILKGNPEIDILQYPEYHIKSMGKTIWKNYPSSLRLISDKREKARALIGDKPILPGGLWGKIYKKKLWDDLRLREDMQFCEDTYIMPEILSRTNVIAISCEGGYNYIIREGSASNSSYTPKKCLDVSRLKFKLFEYALENGIETGYWWNEATQSAIDAWNMYGKCQELKSQFEILQTQKKISNPLLTSKIILKIAQYSTPHFSAIVNKIILRLKKII